jgi:hypothetical protein
MTMIASLPAVEARSTIAIRRFVASDIPDVARLHARVWPNQTPLHLYDDYFRRVFLEHPLRDDGLGALVSEDTHGRVTGFIGVVPRRVVIGHRSYRGAVASNFIVNPGGDAAYVAIHLMRAFHSGPQDVSIADEATDSARALWEALGGSTLHLLSLYWTRMLRPARYATSFLCARPRWSVLARVATPAAYATDALLASAPGTPFHQRPPSTAVEPLTTSMVLARYGEFCPPAAVRVQHDARSFDWLLERTAQVSVDREPLTGVVTRGGRVRGWYIAAIDHDGHCDVVQLTAARNAARDVVDQLFHHAWRRGALAVTGRMDPRFMQALSDTCCLFHRRGPWMLLKTARPELQRAFDSGQACFARIDGEWALRLSVPRPGGGMS